jgi:hypothetical protein
VSATAYVTVVCEHATMRKDATGYLCPRYCGTGRHVLKLVPPLYRPRDVRAPVEVRPHPEPEVRARPALASEVPAGARRLVKAMERAGLESRITYARGTTPDVRWSNGRTRPGRVVDSVAVRGRWLWAVWEDGKINDVWRWDGDGLRRTTVTALCADLHTCNPP